jgi:GT2 family glycosyltransferase
MGIESRAPLVSFLIATFNRRDVLLRTLGEVERCGLDPEQFEVVLVDNASTDGTAGAVAGEYPNAKVFRLSQNRGPCAKNVGLEAALGEFVVFLDDDSYPTPGSIDRMIDHFRSDSRLGAAVFTIILPDGSRECSAYPDVCIGCGTGFRRDALNAVGGLPDDFFMAAEEYDLSLRLLDSGWRIRTFDDLTATHLKTPGSRFPSRIARLDARNNVLLALRYFPDPWRMRYVTAWLERYRLMARANGTSAAFWTGAIQGVLRGALQEHRPINRDAFEQFAKLEETKELFATTARSLNVRRILFVDVGKNFIAYHEAAKELGLEIAGIADARLGGRGLRYRGIAVLSDDQSWSTRFDAAIVSNLSPVHAAARLAQWQRRSAGRFPVIDIFASEAPQEAVALAA